MTQTTPFASSDRDESPRTPAGRPSVVVIDDEPHMGELLSEALQNGGYEARAFIDPRTALADIHSDPPDVVITDLRMGEMDGMTVLDLVGESHPNLPVILVTAYGSIDVAVEATRRGAYHFLTKPFRLKEALLVVERAIAHRDVQRENARLRREVEERYDFCGIIGKSRAMQQVFELIERVGSSTSNVLILGESGTGKELVAKAIHYNSARRKRPFVAVNCSALPEGLLESELFGHVRGAFTGAHATKRGLFEEASDGTLFLDEIGDMPLSLQARLLRAIQEKTVRPVGGNREVAVRTRIVAATHGDLMELVREGTFREDLYYRLSVIPIQLPPLRDRMEDLPLLVDHFLERVATSQGLTRRTITPEAIRVLTRCRWDGNVRQLENMVERACVLSRETIIDVDDVLDEVRQGLERHRESGAESLWDDLPTLQEMERRYIVRVLRVARGSQEKAAQILGIDRKTLYRWRTRFGLDAEAGGTTDPPAGDLTR